MENVFLVETILKWLNNPNQNPSKISAIFLNIRYNDCIVQGLAGTTARPMAKTKDYSQPEEQSKHFWEI